jgi:hypothetical protein
MRFKQPASNAIRGIIIIFRPEYEGSFSLNFSVPLMCTVNFSSLMSSFHNLFLIIWKCYAASEPSLETLSLESNAVGTLEIIIKNETIKIQ